MNLKTVHIAYKIIGSTFAITISMFFYHDQFITEVDAADYTTTAQMEAHNVAQAIQTKLFVLQVKEIDTKLNGLIAGNTQDEAYRIIENIEGDIKRHNQIKNDNPVWFQFSEEYNGSLETAIDYKDCVMGGHSNCNNIKDRIYQ